MRFSVALYTVFTLSMLALAIVVGLTGH